MRQQQTIADTVQVAGFGYWSGRDIAVEVRPAPADTGVVFVRRDVQPEVRITATVDNRVDMPLRTTLTTDGESVEMVEHVLAACAGLQVDNCEIWVDGPELPGFDGSSQPVVDALLEVGTVTQDELRAQLVVAETVRVEDGDAWVEARPHGGNGLSLRYELDYGDTAIGRQDFELTVTTNAFVRELASARTFLLEQEAEQLRAQGLGLRVTTRDLLVFGPNGPIDNELRFDNECVRHKALDCVGDFALAGCDLVGQFVAHRSGHRLNAEMVKRLLASHRAIKEQKRTA